VNLLTGELREHRRDDAITKCTAVTPGGACPLWEAALQCWTAGDSQLARFLQRLMGYSLTGSTREEVFVFF
jgi:putative DNA primase/helicase